MVTVCLPAGPWGLVVVGQELVAWIVVVVPWAELCQLLVVGHGVALGEHVVVPGEHVVAPVEHVVAPWEGQVVAE